MATDRPRDNGGNNHALRLPKVGFPVALSGLFRNSKWAFLEKVRVALCVTLDIKVAWTSGAASLVFVNNRAEGALDTQASPLNCKIVQFQRMQVTDNSCVLLRQVNRVMAEMLCELLTLVIIGLKRFFLYFAIGGQSAPARCLIDGGRAALATPYLTQHFKIYSLAARLRTGCFHFRLRDEMDAETVGIKFFFWRC
jgi:hypothetical protein